jgi:hypothetical protein
MKLLVFKYMILRSGDIGKIAVVRCMSKMKPGGLHCRMGKVGSVIEFGAVVLILKRISRRMQLD